MANTNEKKSWKRVIETNYQVTCLWRFLVIQITLFLVTGLLRFLKMFHLSQGFTSYNWLFWSSRHTSGAINTFRVSVTWLLVAAPLLRVVETSIGTIGFVGSHVWMAFSAPGEVYQHCKQTVYNAPLPLSWRWQTCDRGIRSCRDNISGSQRPSPAHRRFIYKI